MRCRSSGAKRFKRDIADVYAALHKLASDQPVHDAAKLGDEQEIEGHDGEAPADAGHHVVKYHAPGAILEAFHAVVTPRLVAHSEGLARPPIGMEAVEAGDGDEQAMHGPH